MACNNEFAGGGGGVLLNNLKGKICGNVRKFVMLLIIFWTICLLDLAQNCINTLKLQVLKWELIFAPLVADLFLFCYERDFMLSLSGNYQADFVEAFNP